MKNIPEIEDVKGNEIAMRQRRLLGDAYGEGAAVVEARKLAGVEKQGKLNLAFTVFKHMVN